VTTESIQTIDRDFPAQGTPDQVDSRSHHGSLRSKLVLSLAAIFFVFLLVDELVRHHVINPEFVALEKADAIRDSNRVVAAMNAEVEHLTELTYQWASRIDKDTVRSSESERLSPAESRVTWRSEKIDWAAIVEKDGSWRWLSGETAEHDSPTPIHANGPLRKIIRTCIESNNASASGMTRIGDQSLVMFATVAIDAFDPTQELDQTRYLVVVRGIDAEMVTALRRQTQVEFAIQPPRTQNPSHKPVVWVADESTLMVELQLTGSNNEGLANICIRESRDITARSSRTTAMARNSFILGSVAALLMLLLLLQRIVIGPLTAIREHSNLVAEQGLATEPLVVTVNDEIGQLAGSFDHMVDRLRNTQTRLAKASQAAGRSQVASTVIHNVGNVLTNVNSLLAAATDRVQGLRVGPLDKLATRLKQANADEALIKATPDYLEGLAGSLRSDQQTLRQLLETLHDNIRHIHDVIRDQQRHTDHSVEASPVHLKTVLEEAIGCCQARLDQDRVSVELSGPLAVTVQSNQSLLLQILINIIGNARLAMRENEAQPRKLRIDVEAVQQSMRIQFRDSGCGMTEKTIQKVFDAHFTTRESGTGLGLHFCALTLKRLGGSIRASSEGLGHGSTFVVELPIAENRHSGAPLNENLRATAAGATS
jgi:signal transduction histidine kinase